MYGQRGTQSTSYARYLYLYGATLTIYYTTAAEYITTMTTEKYNSTKG